MRLFVALLFLFTIAGCAGPALSPSAPADDLPAEVLGSQAVAAPPQSVAESDFGRIQGRVSDLDGKALAGALVLLAGVVDRATSDSDGSFLIDSVEPGAYVLQARLAGYAATGTPLQVQAGAVTRVNVTLAPLDAVKPDVVDFWQGRERVLVADADFAGADTAYAGQCLTGAKSVWGGMPVLRFDDPHQLVWPGTAAIEVVLDWSDAAYSGGELLLAWREHPDAAFRLTDLTAKGVAMVLEVTPEEADRIHQRFTSWQFNVCSKDESGSPDQRTKRFDGELHATITLVRGHALPTAEPEPDLWGGADRLLLVDERLDLSVTDPDDVYFAVFAPCNGVVSRQAAVQELEAANAETWQFALPDGLIVPPGTLRIEARLEWTYGGLTVNPVNLFLSFRGANVPPWEPIDPARETVPDAVEAAEGLRRYATALPPDWTDGADDARSAWSFFWNLEGSTPLCDRLQVHLVAEAVRGVAAPAA